MLLAQLSDTHLLANPRSVLWSHNTTRNLAAVLDALPPRVDALVVTGDVAEDGAPAAYDRVLALTERRADTCRFLPGNHDDVAAMSASFGVAAAVEVLRLSDQWSMAMLNSKWDGHEAGRLGHDTLRLLSEAVHAADSDVVLCLHHPPLSPCPEADCVLSDGEALHEAIEGTRVRVVLSGHVHQAFETISGGVTYLGAPSTFRQLRHGGDPHYADTQEPPAARLVELHEDGTFASEVVVARA